ncbi:MAG: hypothetical protein ACC628_22370 [Pirellulaceae bacterium]
MRFSLKRAVAGLVLVCLVFSVSGCKSGFNVPGMSWLNRGGQPAPTQLSSTAPKKPSSGALPSPAMTMGSGTRGAGSTSFASSPYRSANTGSNQGYFTGPYPTNQTSPPSGAASSAGNGYPTTQYPNGMASTTPMGSRPAAGYQSPYQSPAAPRGNTPGIRTADARNGGYNAPNVTLPNGGSAFSTSPAAPAWQPNQPSTPTRPYNNGQVAPTGYGVPSGTSYPQPGAMSAPSQFSTPASGASQAGLNQRQGPYRPGSTARDTGTLSAGRPPAATGIPATPSTYNNPYQQGAPAQPASHAGHAQPAASCH